MQVFHATQRHEIREFVDIRRQWRGQLELGNFYAEGEQVIFRLLQSNVLIHSLLIASPYFERWNPYIKPDRVGNLWLASKKWIEEETSQKLNQPCLALAKVPEPQDVSELLRPDLAVVVALDRIDHAVNVGAILRNCAAFAVTAVVLNPNHTIHPYSLRSVQASLGGVFAVPVFTTDNLTTFLENLRDNQDFELIAADPTGPTNVNQMNFRPKCCVILGNEHAGLSHEVQDLQPHRVSIRICENVDSVNVAAASAIFLHKIFEAKSFLR